MITDTGLVDALRIELQARIDRKRGHTGTRTLRYVADEAGISTSHLCMILSGTSSPLGLMLRLAQQIGVPMRVEIGEEVLR